MFRVQGGGIPHLDAHRKEVACRIDVPGVAQAPQLLGMGMPTTQQRGIVATQELPDHLIWRLGQNDLVEGTR